MKNLRGWCLITGSAIAILIFYSWNPAQVRGFPPCLFLSLTGLYCPGCGTQRAIHQLLHGHFGQALGLNALAVLASPFLAYYFASYIATQFGLRPLPMPAVGFKMVRIVPVIIVLFWILRNLRVHPFSLLAPG